MTEERAALNRRADANEIRCERPDLLLPEVAPGVFAHVVEEDGGVWVPLIFSGNPGQGNVGRWLDTLPRDRRVVFPTVLSSRLAGMLIRRGFRPAETLCAFEGMECVLEVIERLPEGV